MVVEPLKRQFGHSFPKPLLVILILLFSTVLTLYINKEAINYVNIEAVEITTQNIDSFSSNVYKAALNNVTINPNGVVCNEEGSCIATLIEFGNKIVIPIEKDEISAAAGNFRGSLYILDKDQISQLSKQFGSEPKIETSVFGDKLSEIILNDTKKEEIKINSDTKIFQHSISMSRRGVYGQTFALGILCAAFLYIILNKFLFN